MFGDSTMPSQMPLSAPQTLEPFVDQFAQAIATQEAALQEGPSPDVQRALMRVRQTWLEQNASWLAFGAGLVGVFVVVRMLR
jgi:hypothetical protein